MTMIPAWVNGTLEPVEKLAVHQRGLRHPAVSVFVMDGAATLLQRRALAKYHTPGLWANACCTHPDWGELPEDTARRRLVEELGLRASPITRDTIEYRADVGGGLVEHEVVTLFVADVTRPLHLAPNPDEVMETRWITLDDLRSEIASHPARFTPWLRIYVAEHAHRIFAEPA